ncbi:hypothetical protein BDE02_11G005300 [Populus trichocarpa]|jgi:hypothetical protein|nr:hypothetical protein BDE02_11G005300 [Populus trichocarpa]
MLRNQPRKVGGLFPFLKGVLFTYKRTTTRTSKGREKKKERRKDRVEEKRLLTRRRKERSKQQKPCTATVSFLSIIRSVQVILSLSFNKIVRTMIRITLIFSLSLYIDLLAE